MIDRNLLDSNVGYPVSIFSFPCMVVIFLAFAATGIISWSSYSMGRDTEGTNYTTAAVYMSSGLFLILAAIGILKFVE